MLVHHSRLRARPWSTSDDPYFGPRSCPWTVTASLCGVLPDLGGPWCALCNVQLKHYYDPDDLCGQDWELSDEEIAALNRQGAASPIKIEGELPT